jgi:tryptophan synthase alpha subunit
MKATERALRFSERRRKKVCMKTRYLVTASSSASTVESTTEESSGETYVNPVQQLKGKEKKVSLLLLTVLR